MRGDVPRAGVSGVRTPPSAVFRSRILCEKPSTSYKFTSKHKIKRTPKKNPVYVPVNTCSEHDFSVIFEHELKVFSTCQLISDALETMTQSSVEISIVFYVSVNFVDYKKSVIVFEFFFFFFMASNKFCKNAIFSEKSYHIFSFYFKNQQTFTSRLLLY